MAKTVNTTTQPYPFDGVLSFERHIPRPELVLPVLVGLLFGMVKLLGTLPHPWASSSASPDDLARLAQVQDFVDGQGWFDLLQTRLDPPAGVWMHWSRLVDAPIAGLMWLGDSFGSGEAFALMVWPLLLLVAFFIVIANISRDIVGDKGIFFAVFVTVFFESTLQAFRPGRIDHHNVQIVLSALLILALIRLARGRRWGVFGGAAAGLMIGIGIETLPFVAVGTATAVGLWLWDGNRHQAGVRAYGLSFAASTIVVFALSVPPSRYLLSQCDSISLAHLVPAVIGGVGLALTTFLVPAGATWRVKSMALVPLGVACLAVLVVLFPHCLGDPYAFLEPKLREVWLSKVSEARGAFTLLQAKPYTFALNTVPLVVLMGTVGWALSSTRTVSRKNWCILGIFALTGILVCIVQVRFYQFTHILCIPAAAWLMTNLYDTLQREGVTFRRVAALMAVPLIASPWIVVLPKLAADRWIGAQPVIAENGAGHSGSSVDLACQGPTERAAFAAVPHGVAAAPVFFGSTVLALSDLSVLAAPYHRGQAGILDTYEIFSSPPERARAVLDRRGVDYVLFCPTNSNRLVTGEEFPGSLADALEDRAHPDWLIPVGPGNSGNLTIYRVDTAR